MPIETRKGDVARVTVGKRPVVIPHVVNDQGIIGAGVSGALIARWPVVESDYRALPRHLGTVQLVSAEKGITVANMVAQHGVATRQMLSQGARPPIRYAALSECMRYLAAVCLTLDGEIACPRFGSDLAGGHWPAIEQMILEQWCDLNIPVTVYTL